MADLIGYPLTVAKKATEVRNLIKTFPKFASSPTHEVIREALKMFHSLPFEAVEDGFNKFPGIERSLKLW